jgi:hypothetical protein
MDSCWPGRIFWSSRSPSSSLGTPPFLHATEATSNPWDSRMLLSVLARSTMLMQVAMPILVKPSFLASAQISSTRVHRQ